MLNEKVKWFKEMGIKCKNVSSWNEDCNKISAREIFLRMSQGKF